jgi:hypothetical protein
VGLFESSPADREKAKRKGKWGQKWSKFVIYMHENKIMKHYFLLGIRRSNRGDKYNKRTQLLSIV